MIGTVPFFLGKVYAYLKYGVAGGEVGFKKAATAVRDAALEAEERGE